MLNQIRKCFCRGLKKVNAVATNCIVFEDSVAGIQAANVAQMTSIGIGEVNVLNEAQFCFQDFTQISEDFLQELIKK